MRAALVLALLLSAVPAQSAEPEKPLLVVCAPGYPGTAAEAQPSMDALAAAATKSAGWPDGSLGAVYEPTEQGGLARLKQKDSAMAMVTLPFWVKHGQELKLEPRLEVVMQGGTGPTEVWTLVAKKGRITSPDALANFTIASTAGYAPAFVRGALSGWGKLPDSVKITNSPQVLSQLRKAASGADVAVLLDGAQTASISSLPFASDLEVVARSEPLPVGFVAAVDQNLPAPKRKALEQSLTKLSTELQAIRMSRFVPADPKSVAAARRLVGAEK